METFKALIFILVRHLTGLSLIFTSPFALAASPGVSFSVIKTAQSSGSLEAMVVSGGRLLEPRYLVHNAVLIRHPEGDILWDTGIGRQIEMQVKAFGFLDRQLFKVEGVDPARDQLERHHYNFNALKAIIPSHMHWDHVSGLEDFVDIPVWTPKISHSEAKEGEAPAFIEAQYDAPELRWKYIDLTAQAYLGFSRSLDIYGDGRLVLVDLSGHTNGHLGLFVNLEDGSRYFFIGDTTWVLEGIQSRKSRPVFVNWLVGVDTNVDENFNRIEEIYQLSQRNPEIIIVPTHDEKVLKTLPLYPEFR